MALILYKNNIQQYTEGYLIGKWIALILYKNNIQRSRFTEDKYQWAQRR